MTKTCSQRERHTFPYFLSYKFKHWYFSVGRDALFFSDIAFIFLNQNKDDVETFDLYVLVRKMTSLITKSADLPPNYYKTKCFSKSSAASHLMNELTLN